MSNFASWASAGHTDASIKQHKALHRECQQKKRLGLSIWPARTQGAEIIKPSQQKNHPPLPVGGVHKDPFKTPRGSAYRVLFS
jgi:hypothetical protein